MASLVSRFVVSDFDTWKRESFDADLVGRRQLGTGHRLYRGISNPNDIFLMVDFASPDDARSFRSTLSSPEALESAFGVGTENPRSWIIQEVEAVTYPEKKRRGFLRRRRR
jgi:hypothetical protein